MASCLLGLQDTNGLLKDLLGKLAVDLSRLEVDLHQHLIIVGASALAGVLLGGTAASTVIEDGDLGSSEVKVALDGEVLAAELVDDIVSGEGDLLVGDLDEHLVVLITSLRAVVLLVLVLLAATVVEDGDHGSEGGTHVGVLAGVRTSSAVSGSHAEASLQRSSVHMHNYG